MVHVHDTSIGHRLIEADAWRPSLPARRITDHIWESQSDSFVHLVAGDSGDLLINTGKPYQAARHRERLEYQLGRPLDVRAIILTQSHYDFIGGWQEFAGPGVDVIAHERLLQTLEERRRIAPYLATRPTAKLFARRLDPNEPAPAPSTPWEALPDPAVSAPVHDSVAFEVGGRAYEVLAVPGGETLDGLAVWLPEERTVWIGNLMGALWGAMPNLSTIRGDRLRSASLFIESVEKVLALEPELLLAAHGEPVRGAHRIRAEVGRIVAAVRYVHDQTIEGMNAGRSLWELMDEIELPAHLTPETGRCPTSWNVRAVWEEYVGWFRAESLTELYATPQRAIWAELVELAGGPDVLVGAARRRLAVGEPLEAMHHLDMVLGVDPDHRRAHETRIGVLEELLLASRCEAYDEARLLELEIERERAELSAPVTTGKSTSPRRRRWRRARCRPWAGTNETPS